MEKRPISTGFLGFLWKLAYFLRFLPVFYPEDAISAAFLLHEREEWQARNCAIAARTVRVGEVVGMADFGQHYGRGRARARG